MIKVYCDFCKLPSKQAMGLVELHPRWQREFRQPGPPVIRKDICKDCAKTLELDDTQ